MERVKVILKRIFVLPPLPTLLIAAVSFPAVIYVLACREGRNGICLPCIHSVGICANPRDYRKF